MPSPDLQRLLRFVPLLAFLFSGFIYTALLWHSNFHMAALQIYFAAIAWWNRRWALYALVLLFPFFGNQPGTPYGMHFIDLTLWLILAIWLFDCIRARRYPFVLRPIGIWLLLAWVWAFITFVPHLSSQAHALAWRHGIASRMLAIYEESVFGDLWPLHAFLGLTQSLLFFFYVKDQFSTAALRRQLLRFFLIAASTAMLLGLLDFFHILRLDWFRPPPIRKSCDSDPSACNRSSGTRAGSRNGSSSSRRSVLRFCCCRNRKMLQKANLKFQISNLRFQI